MFVVELESHKKYKLPNKTIFIKSHWLFIFEVREHLLSKDIQSMAFFMQKIMEPKEKAEQLIEKFMFSSIYFTNGNYGAKLNAKTCALIAVKEMIEQCKDANFGGFGLFWQEVKQEIEKL